MKSNMFKALTILAAALAIAVPMIQAQSRLDARVPFAFIAGEKSMPAGSYEISTSGAAPVLCSLETNQSRFLMNSIHLQDWNAKSSKLVFHKYGDQYFLSEIWDGQSSIGVKLAESRREKETKMAADHSSRETVVIAMVK